MDDTPVRFAAIAERTLAGQSVHDALARTREVIGASSLPVDETDAQAALDKMRNGEPPTDEEWIALQLVVRLMRPAVFTRDGVAESLPTYRDRDQELERLWDARAWQHAIRGVGRIDDANGTHVGTGFVVAPATIATNRHVLELLTLGTLRLFSGAGTISFGEEYDRANSAPPVGITHVAAVHPTLDLVLLAVESPAASPLSMSAVAANDDDYVVAIGYPGDVVPEPLHAPVFGGVYGKRRASPGLIRAAGPDDIDHDCSTLGGSSGSPIVSLATGEVVGVHHQGRSAYVNRAVPVAHLRDLVTTSIGGGT